MSSFIPTGPADVSRLDSTIVGAVAHFHPCRLYMGPKLPSDIDLAARMTLETIWAHFVRGGFRHDAAWNAYGPYLTLQLAHAFLLLGDIARMDALLTWAVGDAAYATVSRYDGAPDRWQVVTPPPCSGCRSVTPCATTTPPGRSLSTSASSGPGNVSFVYRVDSVGAQRQRRRPTPAGHRSDVQLTAGFRQAAIGY